MALLALVPPFLGAASAVWFADDWLVARTSPTKSDYIVALSGSNLRIPYAASLYQQGFAPTVILTGEARPPEKTMLDELGIPYPRSEAIYREILVKLGVPESAIRLVGRNLASTIAEAEALRAALPEGRSLLIVTSAFHTQRTEAVFRRYFRPELIRVVHDPSLPLPARWWTNRYDARDVILEYAKWVFFLAGGRF